MLYRLFATLLSKPEPYNEIKALVPQDCFKLFYYIAVQSISVELRPNQIPRQHLTLPHKLNTENQTENSLSLYFLITIFI